MRKVAITSVILILSFILLVYFGRKVDQSVSSAVISSTEAPTPIGPYSQAVKFGNVVFLSGQVALDLNGKLDTSSLESETHQVMKNLEAILKAGNMDFSNVVKTTIYLTDLSVFKQVNELYGSYFTNGKFPARETVEVSALPKGARIEISMIAAN